MCYLGMLNNEVDECANNIISLQNKVRVSVDPGKRHIYRLQIEHAEMHRYNLCKLIQVFKRAI